MYNVSLDVGEIRNRHAINHTVEINMRYSLVHDHKASSQTSIKINISTFKEIVAKILNFAF